MPATPLRAILLEPFTIHRCDLAGCERQAVIRIGRKHICEFHRMLLSHGRGLDEYLKLEAESERKDHSFGLSLEDEGELEKPGCKADK